MIQIKDVITIAKEVGLVWIFNRALYAGKIGLLNRFPQLDVLFEKNIGCVERTDIFDVNIKDLKNYYSNIDKTEKSKIIDAANNILENKIRLFSGIEIDFGENINWKKNPLTNIEYENVKWFKIPDFDEKMGDVKATWEFNRLSFIWFLIRAYVITDDIKYYYKVKEIITSWNNSNIYSYGPNYKCGQECSLRMLNVLVAYGTFKACEATDIDFEEQVKLFVKANYQKIVSNFFYARKCVKIDHLISELCGLIVGSWCCGEKYQKYVDMLDLEIRRQFNDNGLYESYSLNYQRYVLQLLEYVLHISGKCDFTLSDRSIRLLYRAADVYNEVSGVNGSVPNYGANDGTFVFPIGSYLDYITTSSAIKNVILGKQFINEESIWFSNEGMDVINNAESKLLSPFLSLENENIRVLLNTHKYSRRPGHMDQNHIDIWINGQNVFCDSGTYSYTPGVGDLLRKTSGHNTVFVSGKEQMKCLGRFLVYGKPLIKKQIQRDKEIISEQKFYTGYLHQRRVILEDKNILIEDEVKVKDGKSDYMILFHTPYDVQIVDDSTCIVEVLNVGKVKLHSDDGKVSVDKSVMSYTYLDEVDIYVIRIDCEKSKNRTLIEVL